MCFAGMLGTNSALGPGQDTVWVDLLLKLVEHGSPCRFGSGCSVNRLCP
jgi:hypothetical protein